LTLIHATTKKIEMSNSFLIIIDRQPAINLYRAVLEGERRECILRLIGESKMGKTHMLRVYRHIAEQEYNARCAVIDLRSRLYDCGDLLHLVAQQLGLPNFENYQAAHDKLASQPQMQVSGLMALLSRVSLRAEGAREAEQYQRRWLTAAFLQDLEAIPRGSPIVLLFDAFEQADRLVQDWLNESMLPGLSRITNVRVVVAGQTLPKPPATYHDVCCTHELPPVSLDDHRLYCARIRANLSDEQIEVLHRVLDGKPGLFVELVAPKYSRI
jgi:hypothetical protein